MTRAMFRVQKLRRSEWAPRSPTIDHDHGCTLFDVVITYGDDTQPPAPLICKIPCFSCTGLVLLNDYYALAEDYLTDVIREHAHVPQHAAHEYAKIVACSALDDYRFDCNGPFDTLVRDTVHVVDILVPPPRVDGVERAIVESFEEAVPVVRPATRGSLDGLYKMRCEQERKEALEKSWGESEHECVICMDGIEELPDSLTMPCSHVFHEDCLKTWLENSHVCPLCRFELPHVQA